MSYHIFFVVDLCIFRFTHIQGNMHVSHRCPATNHCLINFAWNLYSGLEAAKNPSAIWLFMHRSTIVKANLDHVLGALFMLCIRSHGKAQKRQPRCRWFRESLQGDSFKSSSWFPCSCAPHDFSQRKDPPGKKGEDLGKTIFK